MIFVIGATGFTGKLVAHELGRLGLEFVLCGRNAAVVKQVAEEVGSAETRIIDVENKSTFAALDGAKVIINCAGPFTDFGEIVVQEAISRRAHYLDLTGEQGFIKLVYDRYDQAAKEAGIVLVPACAFEYAIGDSAAAILCSELSSCDRVEIFYHVEGMYTSPGTRKSVIRAMAAPGFQLIDSKLVEIAPGRHNKQTEFNGKKLTLLSFPAGEVLMLPKHSAVRNVSTYLTADMPSVFAPLITMTQPIIRLAADFLVSKAVTNKVPSLSQRKGTSFVIRVEASSSSEKRTLSISGNDPYGLTAEIIVAAALHLEKNGSTASGAVSPSMIASASLIRNRLEQSGVRWQMQ